MTLPAGRLSAGRALAERSGPEGSPGLRTFGLRERHASPRALVPR